MSIYKELKDIVYECNMELPKLNLVIFTFGNVSAIDRDKGVIAIKPSSVPYGRLKPQDIVVIDMDGKIVEGRLHPSTNTKTHTLLYKNFPTIGGIAHTHSTYAVVWAQAMMSIPNYGTTHADHLLFDIPCTDVITDEMVKGEYEIETGNQIIDTLKKKNLSYEEVEMILVACHGPFTWGKTPQKAVYNSAMLEELAKTAYMTRMLNPSVPTLKESLIDKYSQRKRAKSV